jgi:23S rRNA (uracil1939-C5)-methyltransferase
MPRPAGVAGVVHPLGELIHPSQTRRKLPQPLLLQLGGLIDTDHVETVVLLSHKKPDGHINVKVEFGEGEGKVPLDNIAKRAEEYKPKERVTYKMIKEYIEAKYGFKVHTAYIAEVKRDLGLPMYDAPNAVEELKQPRKHPTVEKVEAIKDALKHFEVI